MKLKINCNIWKIYYTENNIDFLTMFNSGFIDDVNTIVEYFIKENPNVSDITIEKSLKQKIGRTYIECSSYNGNTHYRYIFYENQNDWNTKKI